MKNRDHRSHAAATLLHMPRVGKRLFAVLVDIALCALTVWLALCLRLEHWVELTSAHGLAIMGAVLIALPLFIRFGLYRAVIRYLPERTLWTIASAVVLSTLVWISLLFVLEITRLCMQFLAHVGGQRIAHREDLLQRVRRPCRRS